jgi:hypothetical protein
MLRVKGIGRARPIPQLNDKPQKACRSEEHSEEESDVLGKKQIPRSFSLVPLAANGSE